MPSPVHLPPNDWLSQASTVRVMKALNDAQADCARFVGGCVRNTLLGDPVSDIDIATQLRPEQTTNILRKAGCAVHPTGIEHGTVTAVADNVPFEITTLRRDVETDGRRAVVAFTADWSEDAQRRDFRINALYASATGEVYDPTGGGLDDAENRRIVFVGDAETRIKEDYLRILRFFRFYARYGNGAPNQVGLDACAKLGAGLETISVERIWMETKKLLQAPDPRGAITAMKNTGVLQILFPAYTSTQTLENMVDTLALPDPLLRFTALFANDAAGFQSTLVRVKASNDEKKRMLSPLTDTSPLRHDMNTTELDEAFYRSGRSTINDRIALEIAKVPETKPLWQSARQYLSNWERPQFPVSGQDLLNKGLKSGKAIGEVLKRLEEKWIASNFKLTRDELLGEL